MHVLGYVIDPQGQASYLWAATDESKAMRSSQQLDIAQTMRDYETLIRYVGFVFSLMVHECLAII